MVRSGYVCALAEREMSETAARAVMPKMAVRVFIEVLPDEICCQPAQLLPRRFWMAQLWSRGGGRQPFSAHIRKISQGVRRSMGKFGNIRQKAWVDFHPFRDQAA
jgi:hypothetical protein